MGVREGCTPMAPQAQLAPQARLTVPVERPGDAMPSRTAEEEAAAERL